MPACSGGSSSRLAGREREKGKAAHEQGGMGAGQRRQLMVGKGCAALQGLCTNFDCPVNAAAERCLLQNFNQL